MDQSFVRLDNDGIGHKIVFLKSPWKLFCLNLIIHRNSVFFFFTILHPTMGVHIIHRCLQYIILYGCIIFHTRFVFLFFCFFTLFILQIHTSMHECEKCSGILVHDYTCIIKSILLFSKNQNRHQESTVSHHLIIIISPTSFSACSTAALAPDSIAVEISYKRGFHIQPHKLSFCINVHQ